MNKVAVVVPNWNGKDSIEACLESLRTQSLKHHVIVVENGSTDGSLELLKSDFSDVELVINKTNLGFAGGVNSGIKIAIKQDYDYIALLNNDAVAGKDWLKHLVQTLNDNEKLGIVTSKIVNSDGSELDSTGDYYTTWGLPYPRGRGEANTTKYDHQTEVFAASGGASLYRLSMLQEIGLFDEDFFAYYEDVDISFRAQLAGWKVSYVPNAIVNHQIGATSSKLRGFTTYQTMKNLQLLLFKNIPRKYLYRVGWRYFLAESLFFFRAITRGQGVTAFQGDAKGTYLLLHNALGKRRLIQKNKKVTDEYIWGMLVHDLPPNAVALRSLRAKWWMLRRKKA